MKNKKNSEKFGLETYDSRMQMALNDFCVQWERNAKEEPLHWPKKNTFSEWIVQLIAYMIAYKNDELDLDVMYDGLDITFRCLNVLHECGADVEKEMRDIAEKDSIWPE